MKATQLRIGNLIYDMKNGREGIVLRLNGGSDYPITYNYNRAFEYTPKYAETIIGITLTEDWLKKLGFEKYQNGVVDYYKIENTVGHYSISLVSGKATILVSYKVEHGSEYAFCWDIQFVHQLQNLYYAITHEELKIVTNGKPA